MDYTAFGTSAKLPPLWGVDFCVSPAGSCYVEDDLLEMLWKKDRPVYEAVFDKIGVITSWTPEQAKRSHHFKPLGDGLMELRLSVGAEVRFIGFMSYDAPSPIFYVLCGFRKKTNKLPQKYLKLARRRREIINEIRGPTK